MPPQYSLGEELRYTEPVNYVDHFSHLNQFKITKIIMKAVQKSPDPTKQTKVRCFPMLCNVPPWFIRIFS